MTEYVVIVRNGKLLSMNKVSIIVPIYNVEAYLIECLESIVGQSYGNLEIILVNDGSTDQCSEICETYAQEDKHIQVIHKENGGLSDARNSGMAVMTGEYVLFVDSDDCIAENTVECLLQTSLGNDADVVECGFTKFEVSVSPSAASSEKTESVTRVYSAEQALDSLMRDELKQVVWNKMYTASVIDGLLFEKGRLNEDEFWTYQILAQAERVTKIEDELYCYRQQPDSIMGQSYSLRRLDGLLALEGRLSFMETHFPNLLPLAKKTFYSGAMFHYQMITKNHALDPDMTHRRGIIQRVRKTVDKSVISCFSKKEALWFRMFLRLPDMISKIRNQMRIGF